MSPLVSMPPPSAGLRAAAREELRGALEAMRCGARLIAHGRVTERERRLAAAIQMAVVRAERALSRLTA